MRIIEIAPLSNGAHRNQSLMSTQYIPANWAVIPGDMECENFPFGTFEVEENDGVVCMKEDTWTPLPIPEPEPIEEQPSQLDIIEAQVTYTAMMTDTLLEV